MRAGLIVFAIPLAKSTTKAIDFDSKYEQTLTKTQKKDAMEGNPSEEDAGLHTDENDEWLKSRK